MTSVVYPLFGMPGPLELGFLLLIILLIWGPGKLPQVMQALGSGFRQFKDAASGVQKDLDTSQTGEKSID